MRRIGAEWEGSVNDDDIGHDSIPSCFFLNKIKYKFYLWIQLGIFKPN